MSSSTQARVPIPTVARLYIACVTVAAATLLCASAFAWTGGQIPTFIAFLVLAVVTSGLKVSLPGIDSTLSINYIFMLIAMSLCDLPQNLLIAMCSGVAQCVLRAKVRPAPIHLIFNASAQVVSAGVSFGTYYAIGQVPHLDSLPVRFLATAIAYFASNTGSVAGVVAFSDSKSIATVWRQNYLWTAPQYLTGATIGALFATIARMLGWEWAILVLPATYVTYASYRVYLGRVERERRHVIETSELHLRTIEALAAAIDAKHETTHDLRRKQVFAIAMGKELGLSDPEMLALEAASLLHDIGKLAVPEYILSKPGSLTPEEFERIKVHPTVGAQILARVRFPYPVAAVVAAHHEMWDGSGYPKGLVGEEIPIAARILAAVDCFDAITSDRRYRGAMSPDLAMKKIAEMAGTSYDPRVIEVLQRRYRQLDDLVQSVHDEKIGPERDWQESGLPTLDSGSVVPARGAREDVPGFLTSIAAARQEFQTLHELITALGTSLTIEGTLSLLGVHLKNIVPHDCMAIYIIEDAVLVPHYVSGVNSDLFSSIRIPLGQGLSGWVAETGEAIVNGNPSVEPGYLGDGRAFSILMAAMSVPLIGTRGAIGVLSLYNRERASFTRDHLRLLNAISSKAAVTIEHALELGEARRSATTDVLTGLANTRALFLHLDAELSRCARTEQSLCVLVLDLDGFKQINDSFGHLTGNQVLRKVADGLRESCREYDLIARMGGDEFVVVLADTDRKGIEERCRQFVRVVTEAGFECTQEVGLAVSIGEASYPGDGTGAEDLLAAADRRMYATKHSRRPLRPVHELRELRELSEAAVMK